MLRRRVVSIFIFTLSATFLPGQTEKGRFLTSASSSLGLGEPGTDILNFGISHFTVKSDEPFYIEAESDRRTSLNLNPRIGYFVANRFAVGLDMTLAYLSEESGNTSDAFSQTLFSLGPFLRYYFSDGTVLPFAEVYSGFGTTYSKTTFEDFPGLTLTDGSTVFLWGGAVGVGAPLGKKVSVDAALQYLYFQLNAKNNNPYNERHALNNVGLRLGVSIFLGS